MEGCRKDACIEGTRHADRYCAISGTGSKEDGNSTFAMFAIPLLLDDRSMSIGPLLLAAPWMIFWNNWISYDSISREIRKDWNPLSSFSQVKELHILGWEGS